MIVTVYTQPHCYPCDATKRRMTKKGIDFEVKDAQDQCEAWIEQQRQRGLASTPIVSVTDESGAEVAVWAGFQPTKIDSLVH